MNKKRKLARSMMTKGEIKMHVPPFQCRAWRERKQMRKNKQEKLFTKIARRILRENRSIIDRLRKL